MVTRSPFISLLSSESGSNTSVATKPISIWMEGTRRDILREAERRLAKARKKVQTKGQPGARLWVKILKGNNPDYQGYASRRKYWLGYLSSCREYKRGSSAVGYDKYNDSSSNVISGWQWATKCEPRGRTHRWSPFYISSSELPNQQWFGPAGLWPSC